MAQLYRERADKEEAQIKQLDALQAPAGLWYIISSTWLKHWREFAFDSASSSPSLTLFHIDLSLSRSLHLSLSLSVVQTRFRCISCPVLFFRFTLD